MPVQSTAMRGADGYSCGPISGQSAAKDAPAVNEVAKVAFSSPRPLRLTLYSRRGAKVDGDRFVTPQRKMGVTAVDMPLVKIGKAAELLSVSVQTLRKWDSGELVPDRRSEGGVRYYDMGKILGLGSEDMPTIGYAVSPA